ncbi:MAG: nucleotide-binding protein [Methanoregula sp.]|nr:MAG: nucleotide-binding protein [Methanoregula sp.]
MSAVLDTSLFFIEYPVSGDLYTTPSVVEELVDLRSKCRFESLLASGLRVATPSAGGIEVVRRAAKRTGDADKLSVTDIDILALALDLGAPLFSDDFAVHNVAHELGVTIAPVQQRSARKRVWKFRCAGCKRFFRAPGECPICGSPIKRTIK